MDSPRSAFSEAPVNIMGRRIGHTLAVALLLGLAACSAGQEGPISALHHFNKGNEAYRIENYARAIRHFKMAVKLDESSAEVHYNLGLAYFKTGNLNEAVGAFKGALRIDPAMADGHYNLALAYHRLYEPEAAHRHFNTYRALTGGRKKAEEDVAGPPGHAGSKPGNPTNGGTSPPGKTAQGRTPQGRTAQGRTPQGRRPANEAARTARKPAARGKATPAARQPTRPRQPMPPGAPPQPRTAPGEPQKWWIQERFTQKPS
jgi:hypothetical protein